MTVKPYYMLNTILNTVTEQSVNVFDENDKTNGKTTKAIKLVIVHTSNMYITVTS